MAHRVYGPVASRRFGLSLGVDLLPHKTCAYDCVYCQVGPTRSRTIRREDFFPMAEVLADVGQALQRGPRPEAITLAGSGEPTLYLSLGRLIDALHAQSDLPVLLLTKGSLFFEPAVAEESLRSDVLVPSLDAGDEEMFRRINQPHPDLGFAQMVRGLQEVCGRHPGTVRLEVMLAKGINDAPGSIERIAALLPGIRAESVDINTPVRPAPGRMISPCGEATLEFARKAFGPRARVVARFDGKRADSAPGYPRQRILETLARRPCTLQDLGASLGLRTDQVESALAELLEESRIVQRESSGALFYHLAPLTNGTGLK